MAEDRITALTDLLCKARLDRNADFLRQGAQVLAQALMEMEVGQHMGAERYERTSERKGPRNGYREHSWDTRAGALGAVEQGDQAHLPPIATGSLFGPSGDGLLAGHCPGVAASKEGPEHRQLYQ